MASEVQLVKSPEYEVMLDLSSDQQAHYRVFKLGFIDSIQFKLWGHVKVGSIKRGTYELEAHLIRCDVHGFQVTTPSGHYELLVCPACIREREAELKLKSVEPSEVGSTDGLEKYLNRNLGNNK